MRISSSVILSLPGAAAVLLLISSCAGPLEPRAPLQAQRDEGSTVRIASPDDPLDPSGPNGAFYPLDVGNHWSYRNTYTMQIVPPGGPPGTPEVFHSTTDVDLIGHAEQFGRAYVIQQETYTEEGRRPFTTSFLYRQDRAGLFLADSPPTLDLAGRTSRQPVDRFVRGSQLVAGLRANPAYARTALRLLEKQDRLRRLVLTADVQPGEITILAYPLHLGASWHVRQDPEVVETVRAMESLELPAGRFNGWRIEIDWPDLFGPDDYAFIWQSRSGLLKLHAHFVGEATDEAGNPLGTLISDQIEELTGISLQGHGGS